MKLQKPRFIVRLLAGRWAGTYYMMDKEDSRVKTPDYEVVGSGYLLNRKGVSDSGSFFKLFALGDGSLFRVFGDWSADPSPQ